MSCARMPVEMYARACRDVSVCPKEFYDKGTEMYGAVYNIIGTRVPYLMYSLRSFVR